MFQPDQQNRVLGITALENLFVTEYMPQAKGDHVKVYLSALYHAQQRDGELTMEALSQELGMTNGEIEAALRYWERRRLLTRVSDNPLRYTLYHLGERLLTGQDSQGGDQDYIAFSEAVYAVFQGERKVRPADIVTAWEWVTDLKLPQEVVLMLLNYCKDTRGRNFTFKAAAKLALQMREENITSPEEAESFLGHSRGVHQGARGVLRRFNLRRQPTEDELALYNKWTADWGFTPEAVLAACTETVKASNPSFGYLDGILNGLRRRGAAGGAQEVTAHIARETTAMAGAREVLAALGTRVSPTVVLTAYQQLLKQSSHDMVLAAAREVATRRGRFEDIEKTLSQWRQKGINTPDQVPAPSPVPQGRPGRQPLAAQYQQRALDEKALEEDTRSLLEEARKYDEQ